MEGFVLSSNKIKGCKFWEKGWVYRKTIKIYNKAVKELNKLLPKFNEKWEQQYSNDEDWMLNHEKEYLADYSLHMQRILDKYFYKYGKNKLTRRMVTVKVYTDTSFDVIVKKY